MRRADAALLLAGALWLGALAPVGEATTSCAAGTEPTALCSAAAAREPTSLLFGGRLDLNRAAPASLAVLPGIGPARAAAIVAERCRAAFADVAGLERVPGIGPRTRERLEASVSAGPGPAAGCASAGVQPLNP